MLVDLSVVLNKNTPVYPGDPQIITKPNGILDKDGYADSIITFGNHNGTHIDAPSHMIKGGKTLDQFSLEKFTGKGVHIKIQGKFDLSSIKNSKIEEDSFVLFETGMGEKYGSSEYFNDYPAITEDIAEFLVKKKVKIVGVDMCSVDHEPFPTHRILLKNEILIIENLTNLSKLNNKKFSVFAFPLKLQIDGSPARVVAQTE